MKISPLDDRVVIEILDAEEKTAGGIVLPDTAKEKPQRGEIVAVGPGKLLDDGTRAKPLVAVHDIVYFGKYAGTDVRVGDVEYSIMRESDILAKDLSGGPAKKSAK
jgi:chaperonin GroES